ncbi:hypothetical protein K458DRAFT_302754 [Lentithecium fluviatile CBS 122367]|uniref:Uncharacterized protein n=1 Tax=Lentithecium fluviatile CBS 122367 TaxID=1168545 RepID=A0A6G1J2C5_9PLEO|nr:hypothetical protein K458DRAFT_302754 [Lentithecium fluviatile CBS 122367]
MQHFATHLQPGQQTTRSLRAGQYRNAIKRKRDQDSEEPPEAAGGDASNTQPPASSDPSEIAQRRVAGVLPDDEFDVPGPPFPHSAARASKDYLNHAKAQQELAGLEPAVYAAGTTSKSQAVDGKREKPVLRKTHLDVLSTVLHRCLLEGDYDRAARAWGMILRTQVAGEPIDPRNHARWGIGAEVLLRRQPRNESDYIQNEQHGEHGADDEQSPRLENRLFTEEGFELARDYYERFIVQYPNRKMAPHAIDDRTFYPPLFSIWIRSGDTTMTSEDARAREAAIQDEELALAREICERLDQLVVSPPFDKHAQLLLLRGNVGLWISDLIIGNPKLRQQDDDNDWNMDTSEDDHSAFESTSEALRKHEDSLRELQRAQEFFHRAKTNGSRNAVSAKSSVETKVHELTKQMARLYG